MALDVLAARGSLPVETPEWILPRNDAVLTLKLARALGSNLPKTRAVPVLEHLFRKEASDELFLACAESLLRRGQGRARDVLRDALLDTKAASRAEGAAWLLCLSTRPDDLDALVRVAQDAPSPRVARGLGRFGHVDAISTLIHLLRNDNDAVVEASAESLDRITGAGLRETVEELWEIALPPEAREMTDIPKPMRKVEKVVRDSARWDDWNKRNGQKLDRKKKLRGGLAFMPMHIVDELEAKETPVARREDAALELVIATGVSTRFSPHDWVARQTEHLAEMRDVVRTLEIAAGSWCFAGAGEGGRAVNEPAQRRW